jgi:antitoxin component YwqK of YwqJK toxin-antitoxin module
MKLFILPLILISFSSIAQHKSYRLSGKGDTINIVDKNDLKQGRWVVKVPRVRGEPGYEGEGIYKDGKKEGLWRAYTLMGDLFAIERYRWGNKDGVNQYFDIAGLTRQETWKAVNPEYPYDTIDVYDPIDPTKIRRQIVKVEGSSVKHGTWKYFDSKSGTITKTENYILNKLEDPMQKAMAESGSSTSANEKTAKAPVKTKPKEVEAFEKKIGKKKIKVIDGRTY